MSKSKFQTVYGVRIYPIDYLMSAELTESDLNHLFDTNSLLYSVIIGMYRYIGSKKQNCDIIKDCKKDNKWITKTKWTNKQFADFESKLTRILKNFYCISDEMALSKAQWFMIQYGLNVKGNNVIFE